MPEYPVYRLPRSPISPTVLVLTILLIVVLALGLTAVFHLRIEQNARIAKDAYVARQKDLINRRTLWEEQSMLAFREWYKEDRRRESLNLPQTEYIQPVRPAEFSEIEDDVQRRSAARKELQRLNDEMELELKILKAQNAERERRR